MIYKNMKQTEKILARAILVTVAILALGGAASMRVPTMIKLWQLRREIKNIPAARDAAINDSLAGDAGYLDAIFGPRWQREQLAARNQYLFDSCVIQYRARIEREYNMGRIFSDSEINEINHAIYDLAEDNIAHIINTKPLNMAELEMWGKICANPLTANSSLIDMIKIFNRMHTIPLSGMSRVNGRIVLADPRKNKVLNQFYDAYYIDVPNFRIPEFKGIQPEYTDNTEKMKKYMVDEKYAIDRERAVKDFMDAKYAARRDSLIRVMSELQK